MGKQVEVMESLTLDNNPAFAKYKDLSESLISNIYFVTLINPIRRRLLRMVID